MNAHDEHCPCHSAGYGPEYCLGCVQQPATIAPEELLLLRRIALGDTLHGDDPLMSTLERLEARGLGRVRYHFGWYLDITDSTLRLAVEGVRL